MRWRRAVLPSLPWLVCFLSFFLGTGLARTATGTNTSAKKNSSCVAQDQNRHQCLNSRTHRTRGFGDDFKERRPSSFPTLAYPVRARQGLRYRQQSQWLRAPRRLSRTLLPCAGRAASEAASKGTDRAQALRWMLCASSAGLPSTMSFASRPEIEIFRGVSIKVVRLENEHRRLLEFHSKL